VSCADLTGVGGLAPQSLCGNVFTAVMRDDSAFAYRAGGVDIGVRTHLASFWFPLASIGVGAGGNI
jgi:hypothetical protein